MLVVNVPPRPVTMEVLLHEYRLEKKSDEPGFEWFELSFNLPARTAQEAFEMMNEVRASVGLEPLAR
jgi:hypothetical protein